MLSCWTRLTGGENTRWNCVWTAPAHRRPPLTVDWGVEKDGLSIHAACALPLPVYMGPPPSGEVVSPVFHQSRFLITVTLPFPSFAFSGRYRLFTLVFCLLQSLPFSLPSLLRWFSPAIKPCRLTVRPLPIGFVEAWDISSRPKPVPVLVPMRTG